jgi:hypothetical protein
MPEKRTINESEFKKLCDDVEANAANILKSRSLQIKEETALLREVLLRLCRQLGIDPGAGVPDVDGIPTDALTCIFEINEIMHAHADPPFNHSKMIRSLLREALR